LVAGIGGLIGTVVGGRVAERLLARGVLSARVVVPAIALFLAVPFLAGGVWVTSIGLGIILLTIGAFLMAAAGAIVSPARKTYPRDVVTAVAAIAQKKQKKADAANVNGG
ncbi:MAG: hypothetical protein ACREFA_01015, partial [Stellaceae bacterium]